MAKAKESTWGTGRRKCAVARVKLTKGSGKIEVNGGKVEAYFTTAALQNYLIAPLKVTGSANQFDIHVNVHGGGKVGQAGAIRQSLSRALVEISEENRAVLRQNGFLTRDSRVKERKKPGQPGARARFQFSKR